jgi:monofunctional glycosyltransferase
MFVPPCGVRISRASAAQPAPNIDMKRFWNRGEEHGPPADPGGSYPPGVHVRARGRPSGLGVRLLRGAILLLAGFYVLCLVLLVAYRFVAPPTTAVQVQRSVEALVQGGDYTKRREHVPLSALPAHVPRAVVAAEDGRFWDHRGFDLTEMRIAQRDAAGGGRIRGASTITQQLVKNLFGGTYRNPIRKVYDITLTPPAELILGKNRILELYLNQVEWGPGIYGIEAAARHHYGKSASELSRTEAAGLAALLPNPLQRTPRNTGQYRAAILRRMDQRGW